MLTDNQAFAHPSYENAVNTAVSRASREPVGNGESFSVCFDGEHIWQLQSRARQPKHGKIVCIAQRWDANTVQLRFDGARSEWRKV